MTTFNFVDRVTDSHASIAAHETDDGQILLAFTSYPLSGLFSVPMETAVKLAEDILAQARGELKEAA